MRFYTLLFFALLTCPKFSESFAILTHEAVIDVSWEKSILPVLRKRFPNSSDSDYIKAKSYTYGGAITPDIGFFPFGSILFTNLVHYVRSGDFTQALLDEAQDLNEYAFALGALAHYNADNYGHPLGVNVAVAMVYPKDKEKYGDNITYANNPMDHRRIELAFDVLQIARGNYLQENYTGFIGFELSKSLLERAFLKTYGIELGSIFGNLDLSIASFRFSVQNLLAPITKAAWANKKKEIQKLNPEMTDKRFQYTKNRKEYKKTWGKTPVIVSLISGIVRIAPKRIGPARALRFRVPTPEAEKKFSDCFDSVVMHYDEALRQLKDGKLKLSNRDYDTGLPSAKCEYPLADKTYFKLVKRLKHDHFDHVTTGLKENILLYYSIPSSSDTSDIGALYKAIARQRKACVPSGTSTGGKIEEKRIETGK